MERDEVLAGLGINPRTAPNSVAQLWDEEKINQVMALLPLDQSEDLRDWMTGPNVPCLCYTLETEHNPKRGFMLRNLHMDERKKHLTVKIGKEKESIWHNWSTALPTIYQNRIAVLVEGAKDARVCWSRGLPAVAYLRSSPTYSQLQTIRRYCDVVLWIPDVDEDKVRGLKVREQTKRYAERLGIDLKEIVIPCKDTAQMALENYKGFQPILEQYELLRKIHAIKTSL